MELDNPNNFKRRFSGVEHLYGKKALNNFSRVHIVIVGIGGVGSWVVEALARNGVGELTLIDMDVVAESNINRQLPALSSTVGRNKIDVMAERISEINESCKYHLIDDFLTENNISDLISFDVNYVIDCIDSSKVKAALISWCKSNRIKIITLGGAGGQIDPTLIKISDLSKTVHDPLLSKTRKILRRNYRFPTNTKRRFSIPCVYSVEHLERTSPSTGGLSCAGGLGSSVMVTASFGFVAVSYVLKKIAELD